MSMALQKKALQVAPNEESLPKCGGKVVPVYC